MRPRGRLLGGASKDGKMSKIQALREKRRQEAAQKSSPSDHSAVGDDYTQSLNKLRLSQSRSAAKKTEESAPASDADTTMVDADATVHTEPATASDPKAVDTEMLENQSLRAQPSTFATILTSPDPRADVESFSPPANSKPHPKAFDFSEPSPDSLVNKAQSRLWG